MVQVLRLRDIYIYIYIYIIYMYIYMYIYLFIFSFFLGGVSIAVYHRRNPEGAGAQ